jgi:hypothetical protein
MNDKFVLLKYQISTAIGTGIAELITLPLCTIKTVHVNTSKSVIDNSLMLDTNLKQKVRNTAKYIYRERGIRGFYSAAIPALCNQVLTSTLKYSCYRYLCDNYKSLTNTYIGKSALSFIAGVSTSLITHPIELIRIQRQMNQKWTPSILYRGYSAGLSKTFVGSITFYPLFDTFREYFGPDKIIIASFCSAIASTLIMYPFDYFKTRKMNGNSLFSGYNPLNYYKGVSVNLMRIVPHFVIMMTITEHIKNLLCAQT